MFDLKFDVGEKVYVSCDGGTTGIRGVVVNYYSLFCNESNEEKNRYLIRTENDDIIEEKVDCIYPHTILQDW